MEITKSPDYEVLGLGAPIVDQILGVSEEFLTKIPGSKGGTLPVDYVTMCNIVKESKAEPLFIAGGSGANTIKGLAHLGKKGALLGKIGNDPLGKKFLQTIKSLGIVSLYLTTETPTAQVVSLVTPDGERTMRSFLGASQEMQSDDLNPAVFEGVKLVHIEGYSLQNDQDGSLVKKTMELAKNAGCQISFDLSSFEIVERHKKIIVNLIADYCQIVFANRQEIKALAQCEPEKGCDILKDLCDIAVILQGRDGCWVGQGTEKFLYPAIPVVPVDTTGAGDFFACGFLYGYLQRRSLQECAYFGTLLGSAVVQVIGAELSQELWEELKQQMS